MFEYLSAVSELWSGCGLVVVWLRCGCEGCDVMLWDCEATKLWALFGGECCEARYKAALCDLL